MVNDLKQFSDQSLKQFITVMSDLLHKASLLGARGPISFGNTPKGLNKDEQKAILFRLDKEHYISISENEKYVYINENVYMGKSFTDFYDLVHEEHHKRLGVIKKTEKPSYDPTNGILYFGGFKIKLKKHDVDTKQNQLLKYIFIENAKDIAREFDFTEFPFEDVGDKKKFKEICRTACTAINKKIAKETKDIISDFLEFNNRTYGYLKINPKYLPN